ncbi:MAG: Lrp/AsnC family transcriptional regulator [Pseudomonadota bacterium]|jgi:DNA-binding Lrp family transcriptional regulator
MRNSLTAQEERVLAAAQMDWRQDVPTLARATGLKAHAVTYALKRIDEKRVARPFVMYNIHRVGLTDYCVFFNVQGSSKKIRDTVLRYAIESTQTTYVAELTGKYQYTVSIMAYSIFEVEAFFDGLAKRLDRPSLDLSFGIRAQWSILPVKYLGNLRVKASALTRTDAGERMEVSQEDQRMLARFSRDPKVSVTRLAGQLGVAPTTLRYRIENLERKGVILGYPLAVDGAALGRYPFRVLIVARGIDASFRKALFSFACSHPLCTMFVRCLGAWDFELNYDLENLAQGGEMVQELYDSFANHIQSTTTVTELGVWKFHEWPLRSEIANGAK